MFSVKEDTIKEKHDQNQPIDVTFDHSKADPYHDLLDEGDLHHEHWIAFSILFKLWEELFQLPLTWRRWEVNC